MEYDSIVIEMLSTMIAKELNAASNDYGFYIPAQHISREQLSDLARLLYDTITLVEIEKIGKKIID